MIYERRHTREIAELKGLQKVAPVFAAAFMVVMLSSHRRARPQRVRRRVPRPDRLVPHRPLVGRGRRRGVILAALYLLWAYQRVFHGEPDEDNKSFPELKWKEGALLLPFIALIVFSGVYPKPMLDRIEPRVERADRRTSSEQDRVRRAAEPVPAAPTRRDERAEEGARLMFARRHPAGPAGRLVRAQPAARPARRRDGAARRRRADAAVAEAGCTRCSPWPSPSAAIVVELLPVAPHRRRRAEDARRRRHRASTTSPCG